MQNLFWGWKELQGGNLDQMDIDNRSYLKDSLRLDWMHKIRLDSW